MPPIAGSAADIGRGQMVVTRPSDDQMASAARETPAHDVLVDERDCLVDGLGQRIVMASAVRTMARDTQSLAEEELQHRAGTQVKLFAS